MKHISLIASDFDDLHMPCAYPGTKKDAPFMTDEWQGMMFTPKEDVLDYNRLNKYQLLRSDDCPIFRALIRQNIEVREVWADYYVLEDGTEIKIKGYPLELERCRLELLNGASEAFIEVIE